MLEVECNYSNQKDMIVVCTWFVYDLIGLYKKILLQVTDIVWNGKNCLKEKSMQEQKSDC